MLHARIAARAFNTPLLVEPSKAMAFLSGLGPRVLGRRIDVAEVDLSDAFGAGALPARVSLLAGGLAAQVQQDGDAPYPVVDGIAVIEVSGVLIHRGGWIGQSSGQTSYEGIAAQIDAAARDPSIRGVALEIDSFGGEVAGVFDLADRIRALRGTKPVWAFVAEHAFSAGYALASQADRILLPRTGAVGSIGVVVMHADLSSQLDQDGVRVTLIHAGAHKVDGNPYAPLPEAVRDEVQREIDVMRFLFAETVAAGRGARLSQEAALRTEAQTYRGADAVAAGLADEVTDLTRGFDSFRQMAASAPVPALTRATSRPAPKSPPRPQHQSRKETRMATDHDRNDQVHDASTEADVRDVPQSAANADADAPDNAGAEAEAGAGAGADPDAQRPVHAAPSLVSSPQSAAAAPSASTALAPPALPAPATAESTNLADLSTQLRREAAEITEIAAQAGRLGIAIDAAKALREGTAPDALRTLVLERASAAADARDIIAAPPSPVLPKASESPLVAAAKRAAAAGRNG
ncbi:S49 family peptidase [Meridianimarinicoccus sp. RP-17]|uniref:S49 family peptidase n=1 Tax=Meridianimarinicoccus zhengii TaxID=2056810 RepID=UPI000DAF28C8|nr:S49 family peptidase [Phycocomes zhengii]